MNGLKDSKTKKAQLPEPQNYHMQEGNRARLFIKSEFLRVGEF